LAITLSEWERAERQRSDMEAATVTDEELRGSACNFARYARPRAEAFYPLEYVYHLVGSVHGLSVLDLGCGSGIHTLYLAWKGASVHSLDLSWSLLRCTRRRLAVCSAGRGRLTQASAHALPFAAASFDLVFGNAILHHLNPDLAARELDRVLNPAGRAIFQEPMRDSRLIRILRRCIPYQPDPVSPYERPLSRRDLKALLDAFEMRRFRMFSLPHVRLAHVLNAPERAVQLFYKWDDRLLRNAPFLSRYASIAVFELVKRKFP
jgi:SAM-dependent methyltransferase